MLIHRPLAPTPTFFARSSSSATRVSVFTVLRSSLEKYLLVIPYFSRPREPLSNGGGVPLQHATTRNAVNRSDDRFTLPKRSSTNGRSRDNSCKVAQRLGMPASGRN